MACATAVAAASPAVAAASPAVAEQGSWTSTAAPSAPAAPSAVSRPSSTNTGVPAGTTLRQYYGNLVATTAGAVYDGLDIHGFVDVRAPNVTIRRSIIRGGVAPSYNIGLVTNTRTTGLRVEDSELVPEHPSVWIDGVKGSHYTLLRVEISGTVDGAKVFGDSVVISSSWLHGNRTYSSDPQQGGRPSHSDGVQVLGGSSVRLTGNTISGGANSAVQVTQDYSATRDLSITGNYLDGGGCTVNLSHKPLASMSGVTLGGNRFGRGSTLGVAVCATGATGLTAYDNAYADNGSPVLIRRWG